MSSRGDSDKSMQGIFKAGQEVRDINGKLIEIDEATGELIQVASSIGVLQARGSLNAEDIEGSFEKAGIPVVKSVDITLEESDAGERSFTLRGATTDEVVLNFSADGSPVAEEPPANISPEVAKKIEALKARGKNRQESGDTKE